MPQPILPMNRREEAPAIFQDGGFGLMGLSPLQQLLLGDREAAAPAKKGVDPRSAELIHKAWLAAGEGGAVRTAGEDLKMVVSREIASDYDLMKLKTEGLVVGDGRNISLTRRGDKVLKDMILSQQSVFDLNRKKEKFDIKEAGSKLVRLSQLNPGSHSEEEGGIGFYDDPKTGRSRINLPWMRGGRPGVPVDPSLIGASHRHVFEQPPDTAEKSLSDFQAGRADLDAASAGGQPLLYPNSWIGMGSHYRNKTFRDVPEDAILDPAYLPDSYYHEEEVPAPEFFQGQRGPDDLGRIIERRPDAVGKTGALPKEKEDEHQANYLLWLMGKFREIGSARRNNTVSPEEIAKSLEEAKSSIMLDIGGGRSFYNYWQQEAKVMLASHLSKVAKEFKLDLDQETGDVDTEIERAIIRNMGRMLSGYYDKGRVGDKGATSPYGYMRGLLFRQVKGFAQQILNGKQISLDASEDGMDSKGERVSDPGNEETYTGEMTAKQLAAARKKEAQDNLDIAGEEGSTKDAKKAVTDFLTLTIQGVEAVDPHLLPSLTEEFKAYIYSNESPLPQSSFVSKKSKGDGPSPLVAKLFRHIDLSDPNVIPRDLCPACEERTFGLMPDGKKWFCQNPGCPLALSPEKSPTEAGLSTKTWLSMRAEITLALLHFLRAKQAEFEREDGPSSVDPDDPDSVDNSRANLVGDLMNGRTFSVLLQGRVSGTEEHEYRKKENKKAREHGLPPPSFEGRPLASGGRFVSLMYNRGRYYPLGWGHRGTDPRTKEDTSSLMSVPSYALPGNVNSPSAYEGMEDPSKIPSRGLYSDPDDISTNIARDDILPFLLETEWLEDAPIDVSESDGWTSDTERDFLDKLSKTVLSAAYQILYSVPLMARETGTGFDVKQRIANDARAIANYLRMPQAADLIEKELRQKLQEISSVQKGGVLHPEDKGGLDQLYSAIFHIGGPGQGQLVVAQRLEDEGVPVFQPGTTSFTKPFEQAWQMAEQVTSANQGLRFDVTEGDQVWDIVAAVDKQASAAANLMMQRTMRGKGGRLFQVDPSLLERAKKSVSRRANLMKMVLLSASGMFGFGGDYSDHEDTYVQERGGGKGSSLVPLRAWNFSPTTISKQFGLKSTDVADMIEDATYRIAEHYIDQKANPQDQLQGTRLAMFYLVPKPITNAFLAANSEAAKRGSPIVWDDPVAQAGIFVQRLGKSVRKSQSPKAAEASMGATELEMLRGEYSETIPNEVFNLAIRDLSLGADPVRGEAPGATLRAFLALESVKPEVLQMLSEGRARGSENIRKRMEDSLATTSLRRQIFASLDDIWSGYERVLGDLSALVGVNF